MKIIPPKPGKTKNDAVEILPAPDALMRKALVVDGTYDQAAEPAIRRAQAMAARVGEQFRRALPEEVEHLAWAFKEYLSEPGSASRRDAAFRAAHDLRGTAASLEEALAARIAQSLARLMSHIPVPPKPLVQAHVNALRALLRETSAAAPSPVAAELADELERRTQAIINAGKRRSGGGE
jgi:chemotaxis protein histidine kinase CheA